MSKKTIALILCMVMALTVGLGSTLAYLTDTDTDTNVFVVGNVDIELNEDFQQGSELVPGVEVNKDASIENVGNNDAYVWMTVAVPADVHDLIELKWTDDASPVVEDPVDAKDEDGNDYKVYTVKINEALKPGEETPVLLDAVTLRSNVDYRDGGYVVVDNGVATPVDADLSRVDIPVSAFAIQSEGFESFDEAYEAYGNQWGEFVVEVKDVVFTSNTSDMMDALANGNSVAVDKGANVIHEADDGIDFDAKGATITLDAEDLEKREHGYLGFIPEKGKGVSVSNLTVNGEGFVEFGHYNVSTGDDYVADDLRILNLASSLAIKNNNNIIAPAFSHYGNATLNDCVMTGTTAMVDGATPYDAAFSNSTTTTINGGEYGSIYVYEHAAVTINGAEVDSIKSYANTATGKAKLVIGAGTVVGTIELYDYSSSVTAVLTIENGATVDKIIHNGVEYTQEAWLSR